MPQTVYSYLDAIEQESFWFVHNGHQGNIRIVWEMWRVLSDPMMVEQKTY